MAEERNLFMFVCGGVNAGNDGGKAVLSFCAISSVCMVGGMIYGLVMDVIIQDEPYKMSDSIAADRIILPFHFLQKYAEAVGRAKYFCLFLHFAMAL